ncbi:MAG TPA: hypothetical protein VFA26_20750 [Gemmataceae bacterium]|nr:hypothetical protein [Gemmataceae bacterium]
MFRISCFLVTAVAVLPLAALLWIVRAGGAHEGKESPLPAGALKRLNARPTKAPRPDDYYVNALAFSPDSKTLAVWCGDTIRFWELPQAKEKTDRRLGPAAPGWAPGWGEEPIMHSLAYSPDGRILATHGHRELGFKLWDATSGKRRFKCEESAGGQSLTFSPDGQVVASVVAGGVRLRSVKDGKEMGLLDIQPGVVGRKRSRGDICAAFSPDGRLLASGGATYGAERSEGEIRLWDWRAGKVVAQFRTAENQVNGVEFSPDGKLLASCPGYHGPTIWLWDMLTGSSIHRLCKLKGDTAYPVFWVAFSPDGQLVASAQGGEKAVRVWNPFTGEEVAKFVPPDSRGVICVAFSPDGKLLASGQGNGTVILWDATKLAPVKPLQPTADELARWWAQLGRKDKAAWEAVWSLARSGDKATALLKDHLKPAQAPEAKQVARLIADLDANDFKAREAASRELARLGGAVEADLRKALAGDPSAEAKKRLEGLLKPLAAGFETDPAELRQLRGIQVLEQLGTPEAKKLLQALARGAPGARRTRDAQLALDRLHRRQSPPR